MPALGLLLHPLLPDSTSPGTVLDTDAEIQSFLNGASPGDVGLVSPGIYHAVSPRFAVGASGSSGNPITLRAAERGTVSIRPYAATPTYPMVMGDSHAYWKFENLTFEQAGPGSNYTNFWVADEIGSGAAHHVEFWGCEFTEAAAGSGAFSQEGCHHISFLNCRFHDNHPVPVQNQSQGVYITGVDCQVLNCLAYNQPGYGFQIRNNDGDGPYRMIVANCVAFNCEKAGFGAESTLEDCQFWNNIAINCEYGIRGLSDPPASPAVANFVRKNIAYGNTGAGLSNSDPVTYFVFDFDGAGDHTGPGDNLLVDPLFVMSPPQLLSRGDSSGSITNTFTAVLPSGIEENDVVFMALIHDQANGLGVINTPAGWTEAAQGTYQNLGSVDVGRAALFWKRMAGGETASVSVTATGDSGADSVFFGSCFLVRGCAETGNPYDEVVADYGPGSATIDYGAVNVAGIERTMLAICVQAANLTPGTITGYSQNVGSDATGSGTAAAVRAQQKVNLSADAPAVSSIQGTTDGWATFHISLQPPDPSAHESPDFHLQASSPAIGYGNPDYCPPFDHEGNIRLQVDAGAYGFSTITRAPHEFEPKPDLSERGQDLLDTLPPYLADDTYVQTIIDTHARELQRIEDTANAVLTTMFPGRADDTFGFLSLWESMLGLPIAPSVSIEQRRGKVLAALRKRSAGSGQEWVEVLTEALAGTPWAYTEANPVTDPYEVHIYVSSGMGEMIDQIEILARQITPAHLDVTVGTGSGFFIGISQIGLESL